MVDKRAISVFTAEEIWVKVDFTKKAGQLFRVLLFVKALCFGPVGMSYAVSTGCLEPLGQLFFKAEQNRSMGGHVKRIEIRGHLSDGIE